MKIDDQTVYRLLDHIGCEVLGEMTNGKTLEAIDDDLVFLRKKDRIALYEHMVERFWVEDSEEDDEPDLIVAHLHAILAHLHTLKRRKRSPQPTRPPATVLPFRPE